MTDDYFSKRTQKTALALSKTRICPKKGTQTSPLPRGNRGMANGEFGMAKTWRRPFRCSLLSTGVGVAQYHFDYGGEGDLSHPCAPSDCPTGHPDAQGLPGSARSFPLDRRILSDRPAACPPSVPRVHQRNPGIDSWGPGPLPAGPILPMIRRSEECSKTERKRASRVSKTRLSPWLGVLDVIGEACGGRAGGVGITCRGTE